MASNNQDMPPVPYQTPVIGAGGIVNPTWGTFFRQLFLRVGQFVALNNVQLAALAGGITPTPVGSRGAPTLITAAGGVAFSTAWITINFIAGNGGPVVVSATPQVHAGTAVGQLLKLVGCSDGNTVELQNSAGLQLNGAVVLGATSGPGRNSTIDLLWDGAQWTEWART